MASEQDLTALRREIDAIDDAILDLMERRLGLARQTAAVKAKSALPIRPHREAAVINRLQARARGIAPRVVEAIWRELIGQGRQAQAPLVLVLYAAGEPANFELQVRRHFGSAAPVEWAESAAEALRRAREERAIAVLGQRPEGLDGGLLLLDAVRDFEGAVVGHAVGRIVPEGD